MTIGNLFQLEAKGPEDAYLYGNPQITFFKTVYKRATNFAVDYYQLAQNQLKNLDQVTSVRIKIPMTGDLIGGLYLKLKWKDLRRCQPYYFDGVGYTYHPQFTSYVNGLGLFCIDEARFTINGQLIERLTGESIFVYNELHRNSLEKQNIYRGMAFKTDNFGISSSNVSNVETYIQLPFFFTKSPGLYLPICALRQSEMVVELKLKPFKDCLVRKYRVNALDIFGVNGLDTEGNPLGSVPALQQLYEEHVEGGLLSADLCMKTLYLEQVERQLFVTKELSYLIEVLNVSTTKVLEEVCEGKEYTFDLDLYHPTKYISWVIQREDVREAHQYENLTSDFSLRYGTTGDYTIPEGNELLSSGQLLFNHSEAVSIKDAGWLSKIQWLENFHNDSMYPIYVYSFALHPTQEEPTGTLNFSKALHRSIRLAVHSVEQPTSLMVRFYSASFNVLRIRDGLGGLIYNN